MQDLLLYLKLGWEHIISWNALDHQLFILALVAVFSFKDFKKILILVTAFTIGHSITLFLSVLDYIRVPQVWTEFLIPITIILTSINNLLSLKKQSKLMKINYFLALFFGLIHGMGFANTARLMIAKEQNLAIPLFGFNVGLELGQISVVLAILLTEYFILNYLKIKKQHWIIFVSIITLLISLKICFERIPFQPILHIKNQFICLFLNKFSLKKQKL